MGLMHNIVRKIANQLSVSLPTLKNSQINWSETMGRVGVQQPAAMRSVCSEIYYENVALNLILRIENK